MQNRAHVTPSIRTHQVLTKYANKYWQTKESVRFGKENIYFT